MKESPIAKNFLEKFDLVYLESGPFTGVYKIALLYEIANL
jgi:hypothetical protein